jgi:hypothetical protein
MPKLTCPCGFVHNLSPIPDDGWKTVRDKDYESLIEAEREQEEDVRKVIQYWGLLYECPECGRVMWRKPDQSEFTIYRLESE